MRGEHKASRQAAWGSMGSSPHARGALRGAVSGLLDGGIIPACAGSTGRSTARRAGCRDHPRMRGEHRPGGLACHFTQESSPHARGAHGRHPSGRAAGGIIPACAGSTETRSSGLTRCWDHPRMRGEHDERSRPPSHAVGSSPYARGAPSSVKYPLPPGRIIPACAGSTRRTSRRAYGRRDHPRMRGEHIARLARQPMQLGSSPHARGAPLAAVRHRLERGIVPACAGSTSATAMPAGCLGDHSRMRGEHKADYPRHPVVKGSSPHARGAHTSQHQLRGPISESSPHARGALRWSACVPLPPRIIPTCAGNTSCMAQPVAQLRDHPRMRGEHRCRSDSRTAW